MATTKSQERLRSAKEGKHITIITIETVGALNFITNTLLDVANTLKSAVFKNQQNDKHYY
jgi:hypothetical protein